MIKNSSLISVPAREQPVKRETERNEGKEEEIKKEQRETGRG